VQKKSGAKKFRCKKIRCNKDSGAKYSGAKKVQVRKRNPIVSVVGARMKIWEFQFMVC